MSQPSVETTTGKDEYLSPLGKLQQAGTNVSALCGSYNGQGGMSQPSVEATTGKDKCLSLLWKLQQVRTNVSETPKGFQTLSGLQLEVSALTTGIYFIELKSSDAVVRKRFVKM